MKHPELFGCCCVWGHTRVPQYFLKNTSNIFTNPLVPIIIRRNWKCFLSGKGSGPRRGWALMEFRGLQGASKFCRVNTPGKLIRIWGSCAAFHRNNQCSLGVNVLTLPITSRRIKTSSPFPGIFSSLFCFVEGLHRLCHKCQAPDPLHASEQAVIPVQDVEIRGVPSL